jgi:hypothetical protein
MRVLADHSLPFYTASRKDGSLVKKYERLLDLNILKFMGKILQVLGS